ncbi:MAG: YhcH/YjgK/YiaL family protein [Clostridia bacterium]|nr:YhcH/YjgK/YiaL family protein [Clostridia bacterium]
MIYDKLERLDQYRGLNKNLDALIDYAQGHDFASLAPGKNDVDGDNAWVSNNVAALKDDNDVYERHMEYIDLQIPIDEGEIIRVRPVEDLAWPDTDDETRFTTGAPGLPVDMLPGTFCVFFPGDAHNCGIAKAGQSSVRKLVGKARV